VNNLNLWYKKELYYCQSKALNCNIRITQKNVTSALSLARGVQDLASELKLHSSAKDEFILYFEHKSWPCLLAVLQKLISKRSVGMTPTFYGSNKFSPLNFEVLEISRPK
jgi:hypothetical protein